MKGMDFSRMQAITEKAISNGGEYKTRKYVYRYEKSRYWATLYRTPVNGGDARRVYVIRV